MKKDRLLFVVSIITATAIVSGCVSNNNYKHTENTSENENQQNSVEYETEEQTETESTTEVPVYFDYTMAFTGDICIAEGQVNTNHWENSGKDITACYDDTIRRHLQNADICFVNNEFQYTDRGERLAGKEFTFRSDPSNVKMMTDLGVDIVSLANNHVFDFGADGLEDTLTTLQNAGIPEVGAGNNIEEASRPYYFDFNGVRVAFISGTRVEWNAVTRGATETQSGVFQTVDPTLLYQRTQEAKQNADCVIVYIHWGVEGTTAIEDYQKQVGKGLIDAGADAVVGDHTHCLQGIEFYKNKPIIFSLGNFWFNGRTMNTAIAEINISGTKDNYNLKLQYVPAVQSNCKVSYIYDTASQKKYFNDLENMSFGVDIDENGVVTPEQGYELDTERGTFSFYG